MIKFEEHDGLLFKMLDKPVPLTPDAKMPCLVRLIQDDSPMGMYNKKHSDTIYGIKLKCFLNPIIAVFIDNDNIVNAQSWEYYRYEIIGTLAEKGSAEWALYQMMQGKKVCNPTLATEKATRLGYDDVELFNTFWYVVGNTVVEGESNNGILSVSSWIAAASSTGWQIYKEPKPLLADTGIGDIVKTNLGDWLQIVDTPCLRFGHDECYRTHDGLYWDERGVCDVDSTYRLVAVEHLATEGTKEWAWQQMLLGNKVWNPELDLHKTKRTMSQVLSIYYIDSGNIMVRNLSGERSVLGVQKDSHWTVYAEPTGWQIYKEPKPEPQYKVGDWVRYDNGTKIGQAKILRIYDDLYVVIDYLYSQYEFVLNGKNITRKLSPYEIIVRIGCLSGTIAESCDHNYFLMMHSRPITNCNYSMIKFTALDTPTRELVESLLKAQEEEK